MLRLRIAGLLVLICAAPAAAQAPGEKFRITPIAGKVSGLIFKVTDLSGNPVAIAGRVEEIKVRETPTEMIIDLAADVMFDFDKAEVLPKAEETLSKAAQFIRDRARGTVRIEGHTDSKGDDAYNMRLSQRRADAVRNWFAQKAGLGSTSFSTRGLGETQPVAPNEKTDGSDDPDGRQQNRRVQIVIQKG